MKKAKSLGTGIEDSVAPVLRCKERESRTNHDTKVPVAVVAASAADLHAPGLLRALVLVLQRCVTPATQGNPA